MVCISFVLCILCYADFVRSSVCRRILHATDTYLSNNPQLVSALVSVLHKMYRSGRIPTSFSDKTVPKFCVGETLPYYWEFLPDLHLQLLSAIGGTTTNFAFLQDFGGGLDGRVWLVAAKGSGQLAVLKFAKGTTDLNMELSVWNALLPHEAGVTTPRLQSVGGRQALIMPFVFTVRTNKVGDFLYPDRLNPGESGYLSDISDTQLNELVKGINPVDVAKTAIRSLIEAGYEHLDLHWRHVAFYVVQVKGQLVSQPVLIDLSNVNQVNKDDVEAETRMCNALGLVSDITGPTSH